MANEQKAPTTAPKPPLRLLWIDMEMTGLDVDKEVILEVAAVVTDLDFHEMGRYHAILKQPQKYLDKMDDWNQQHHRESGLLDKIDQGQEPSEVEHELVTFVRRHFPDSQERPVLAGNSIGQDRLFINKYMPKFASILHYRMLDVTSWKVLMQGKYKIKYDKKNAHRAIDDIQESIAELRHYLQFIKT